MIGRQLVSLLVELGANVRVVSLDDHPEMNKNVEFKKLNLLSYDNCLTACKGMDYVFHLVGIKGSPLAVRKQPASFFVPVLLFNTNMMEAARVSKVKRYLFTSTLGVYAPAKKFYEDDVWKTFPSPNDRYGAWAKRMGELQAETYAIEYGWKEIAIVRPANVYGPYDNFDPINSMVIPSLIRRVVEGENPLKVWGDGSEVRDFIHARDVAVGMLLAMEKRADGTPINLGSGKGVRIKDLVTAICGCVATPPKIEWDLSKKSGDKIRIMDISRAQKIGFNPQVTLLEGIRETMEWYVQHKKSLAKRYNVFHQKTFI